MKQIFTTILVTILVAVSSCSIIHKQTHKDHNQVDSTTHQDTQFVEYKVKDSTGTIQGIDSNGKITHATWHDETTIHELFDSNGKVTTRTIHKTKTGTGTTSEHQVHQVGQNSQLKTVDSTGIKEVTNTHKQAELQHTEIQKVSKTSPLPWWILLVCGIVFMVYIEIPNFPTLILAFFKRKTKRND